ISAEPPTPETGRSPLDTSCGANIARDSWLMPVKTSGVAIGVICCPRRGNRGDAAETGARSDTPETAGFGRLGFHSLEANCAKETARGYFRFSKLFSESLLNRSIIYCIVRFPPIGTF